jgi:hypothetical protein
MKAGAFLASGAETCVYDPPLKCSAGSPPNTVSRVVYDSREPAIQDKVIQIIATLPPEIRKHFNTKVAQCTEFDITEGDIKRHDGKQCPHFDLFETPRHITSEDGFTNLITPKQGPDVAVSTSPGNAMLSRSKEETFVALKDVMRALIPVDGRFIHNDAHFGNLAWMDDSTLALHDWGRTTVGGNSKIKNFRQKVADAILKKYPKMKYFDYLGTRVKLDARVEKECTKIWDIVYIIANMDVYGLTTEASAMSVMDAILARLNEGKELSPEFISQEVIDKLNMPQSGGVLLQSKRFCKCIKSVRRKIAPRPGSTKEQAAIAICTRSVLKKGRTLKKFKCRPKARIITQRRK